MTHPLNVTLTAGVNFVTIEDHDGAVIADWHPAEALEFAWLLLDAVLEIDPQTVINQLHAIIRSRPRSRHQP
jgi:hypothetical protein